MFAYYLHDFDPVIFHLGGNFGPRWYGMAYVLAFACGFWLLRVLAQRGYTQLRVEQVGEFITWGAVFGVMLGGRLGYVLFYHPEMLRDPLSVARVWEGGMSSHGGMLGLIVFTFWYARRHKISWTNLGDNLVVVAPIGFVSDHMEVVYDLDYEAQKVARELGMNILRARTAGTHPAFVKMIRALMLERINNEVPANICAPDCCRLS